MTDGPPDEVSPDDEGDAIDPRGVVRDPTTSELPGGYCYGVTRFADVVLQNALPERFADLVASLDSFMIDVDELRRGGGGRTQFVRRFDDSLGAQQDASGQEVWGKRNITIERRIGFDAATEPVSRTRGHEIDMFGQAAAGTPFPGVAVEMEWNNKDPFYDRDLINFQALHREGAIVAGVIVTRGPELQRLISGLIRSKDGGFKYGQSSTHWDKLTPRVNLGGGGECPLLLVGIEPPRITNIEVLKQARNLMEDAADFRVNWRETYDSWPIARLHYDAMRKSAHDLLPLTDDAPEDG